MGDPKENFLFLKEKQIRIVGAIDRFQDVLRNLSFEGKPRLGENLRQGRQVILFFERPLARQWKLEEKIIFPFLKRHIPKLDPAIRMLETDHDEFLDQFKIFKQWFRKFSKTKGPSRTEALARIREVGTYIIYLLRNHIRVEKALIDKALCHDLREDEKRLLKKLIGQAEASYEKRRSPRNYQ